MATTTQTPDARTVAGGSGENPRARPQANPAHEVEATEGRGDESALVQVAEEGKKDGGREEISPLQLPYTRLPVDLQVSIPVRGFRVKNLLGMSSGSIFETQWGHGEDLPLHAGDVEIAWVEFEVVESRLAVRVTRLA